MSHTEAQLMQVPEGEETRQPISEDNPLSVFVENTSVPVKGNVGGYFRSVLTEVTRPADTTAYALYDAIGPTAAAVWKFPNCGRVIGGAGQIISATLATDQVANVSTYRLYLYNAPPTAIADNAECTWLYANLASYQGFIDFPALVKDSTSSTGAKIELVGSLLNFVCAGDRNLYGLLQITLTGAFTPASGQKFSLLLGVQQD